MKIRELFSGKKSGIAFGGGGTRGIAHIGTIRVFQENNIDFDYVAGNSVGSMVGALYALDIPWQELYDYVLSIKEKGLLPRRSWLTYFNSDIIETMTDYYLEGKKFSDLNKPFCAIAVDLERGSVDRLKTGSVTQALAASCAVPGVFRPVIIDGKTYVDGGVLRSIPTQTVRQMGAQTVIGINLNADRGEGTTSLKRQDVFMAAYRLSINVNSEICEKYADIMLKPKLGDYARHKLKNVKEMLKIGEETVKKRLNEIQDLL